MKPDPQAARYRLVLGLSTILTLGLSRRLWNGESLLPRVPFLPAWVVPLKPGLIFGVLLVVIASATLLAMWPSIRGAKFGSRLLAGLDLTSVLILIALVVADQHRLQPWIYQYMLLALAFSAVSPDRVVAFARMFVIALYFHSGLSKLDATFTRELGPVFLNTALGFLGVGPWQSASTLRTIAVLAMPGVELLVGLGLIFPATRRYAWIGAILIHVCLLAILSPWGLGHSTIVLVWNAAMLLQVVILFAPRAPRPASPVTRQPWSLRERLVLACFLAMATLPLLERYGLWDTWPSFALYASHGERVEVALAGWEAGRYPKSVRDHLGPVDTEGLRALDLNAWSLTDRGTPVYPQARAMLGFAEALADAPGSPRLVVAKIVGRADRVRGTRCLQTLRGLRAIRDVANHYRMNAHPAGPAIPDPLTTPGGSHSSANASTQGRSTFVDR